MVKIIEEAEGATMSPSDVSPWLRDRGASELANRVRTATRARNAIAHPDVRLKRKQDLERFVSEKTNAPQESKNVSKGAEWDPWASVAVADGLFPKACPPSSKCDADTSGREAWQPYIDEARICRVASRCCIGSSDRGIVYAARGR